jgi:hypothetical protein
MPALRDMRAPPRAAVLSRTMMPLGILSTEARTRGNLDENLFRGQKVDAVLLLPEYWFLWF